MEDPGETGAHPLGAANLNFLPGHQQKEKLVKLGGQPGAEGKGSGKRVRQRQDRWEAQNREEVFTADPYSGPGVCPQAISRPTV